MPQPPFINPLGLPLIELQSVDSTNNYALARVHAGLAQHGEAFFAREQRAGKGQRGRSWIAEKDANIILSIIMRPYSLQLAEQFHLSACTALGTHDFFSRYAGEDTKIKWPNDIYWQDRKAGGILIESVIGGLEPANGAGVAENSRLPATGEVVSYIAAAPWRWSVIGIGINVNQGHFPETLKNPVSLKQITGRHSDVPALTRELCASLENRFSQLLAGGFEDIYNNYLQCLYKKEQKVKLRKDNRVFETVIKGVSPQGKLLTQHAVEEEFGFGEVEWVI